MKSFFNHFFSCFKEGRTLLIRYICVGIYSASIAIFANKLELDYITYFNAVLSLMCFTSILAFAISSGIGIFINNHSNNKDIRQGYIKSGFKLTIYLALPIFFILFIGKDFILHTILNIKIEADLFYYSMIIYFIIDCVNNYFMDILKVTKKFKSQLINHTITSIVMIGGLTIFYLVNSLNLTSIGFLYLSVSFIDFLILSFYINKTYKINIFDLTDSKISKKELSTCIYSIAMEGIWQVGYFLLSFYLLKINEDIFNTYSYFENTLDIFNGILFTYTNINLIRLETLIGEKKQKEAYQTGKYSIYGCLLVWVIYAIFSLLYSKLTLNGINPVLRDTAEKTLYLYLFLHLFRFINWNLSSYILIAGGWLRNVTIMQILSAIYYLILYLIAPSIDSYFYIYLSLAIDSFVIIIWSIIEFRRKKWLTIAYK